MAGSLEEYAIHNAQELYWRGSRSCYFLFNEVLVWNAIRTNAGHPVVQHTAPADGKGLSEGTLSIRRGAGSLEVESASLPEDLIPNAQSARPGWTEVRERHRSFTDVTRDLDATTK